MSPFGFKLNSNLKFGPGSLRELAPLLKEQGYRRVAVIIDSGVEGSEVWRETKSELAECCSLSPYFENEKMEPTYDYLDEVRSEFGDDLDCIIGVGGGSTMDLAKAVSVLVTNPRPAIEYRGNGLVEHAGVPLILIPSTAGSGSEITPYAVFIDTDEQRKFGINSPLYLPELSIIDPMLTLSCPRSVTISSGMDALTHTLEAFTSRKHSPMVRMFAKEAFSLIYNNLPKVVADPGNVELRTRLSLGAHYAGVALFNSSGSTAGVLSYPIGTLFNVTHGMAGASFLGPVVEFNVGQGYPDYADLYDLIDADCRERDDAGRDKSELFVNNFQRFCNGLGIPNDLGVFGVTRSHIPTIIEHLRLLWGAVEQNPVDMTEQDIEAILHQVLSE